MAAGRRCPAPRCPVILTGGERYCPEHQGDYERERGTSTERGYGAAHQALRAAYQAKIDRGVWYTCSTCGLPIGADDEWDLGHSEDKATHIGPQHARCNRSEGGSQGAKIRNTPGGNPQPFPR
ncbi:MAG: hypothetical protein M0R06_24450 [Sphaerochaeta sp.]|jgi:hypothetical protein|nr:hypothetical protein [Sphaerochaeta sp.]